MYVESSLDGPDAQGVEPRPSGPSSTEYESPLVARSLGMPSSAAAADCPTSDTASSMGGGPAVTRTMRSSSSYEKFERHEEVREMHTTAGGPMPALAPQPQYHHTPSRFQFACDTSAPTELSKMQYEAQKRRELFHARVAEIEKRAASWTARLANETIDRELHHEEVMEKSIKQPLEDAAERVMDRLEKRLGSHSLLLGDGRESEAATNNDDDNDNADKEENARKKVPSIMALDRKATDLEEKLIQHSSNSYNARVEHFDTKIDTLTDEVQPALRLETIKADQREAVLNRQYIAIAADATRWYAEENAARVAEHQMLRTTRNEKAAEQPPDAEKILADIRAFRQLLEDERSERQRADEEIMSTIIETRKAWQKIVIESLGE
mmetsp:Transcript_19857/g.46972  ORF Transcript_19857/g.46972 Transcript_19857/m.46972 type:complete len:381 (+) Transcript_19857:90-1232(+)